MQLFARTRLLYVQCSWCGQFLKVTPSASETRLVGRIYQLELTAENGGGSGHGLAAARWLMLTLEVLVGETSHNLS